MTINVDINLKFKIRNVGGTLIKSVENDNSFNCVLNNDIYIKYTPAQGHQFVVIRFTLDDDTNTFKFADKPFTKNYNRKKTCTDQNFVDKWPVIAVSSNRQELFVEYKNWPNWPDWDYALAAISNQYGPIYLDPKILNGQNTRFFLHAVVAIIGIVFTGLGFLLHSAFVGDSWLKP